MSIQDIIVIILGLIIVVIGWLAWKFLPQKSKYLGPFIIASGFIFALIAAPSLKEYVVSLASLLGIFIAVLSLEQSSRIRFDTLKKEQRDHNDKLLDETLDWVKRVGCCPADVNPEDISSRQLLDGSASESAAENFLREHLANWRNRYKDVSWETAYILNIAANFGDNLTRPVNELIDLLKRHNNTLEGIIWKDSLKYANIAASETLLLNSLIENVMLALSDARISNNPKDS